jgi:hypothetical protein
MLIVHLAKVSQKLTVLLAQELLFLTNESVMQFVIHYLMEKLQIIFVKDVQVLVKLVQEIQQQNSTISDCITLAATHYRNIITRSA